MGLSRAARAEIKSIEGDDGLNEAFLVLAEHFQTPSLALQRAVGVYGPLAVYEDDPDDVDGPFALRTARELIEQTPEPPKAVAEGVLPDRRLVLLSGDSKFGKSLLVLDMLASIVAGEKLWGEIETGAAGGGIAVYYCMEDGAIEAKERLLRMNLPDEVLDRIYICTQQRLLSQPENWQRVQEQIAGLPERPRIVVIDTMREAYKCDNWSDQSQVPSILRPLRKWARQNTLVLLVHHNNKVAEAQGLHKVAGSGAIVSSVDGVLLCENKKRLENGDIAGTITADGRSGMKDKYLLQMDTKTHRWRMVAGDEIARINDENRRVKYESVYNAIERALLALGPKNVPVEAIAKHTGQAQGHLRSRLSEMEDDGRLLPGEKVKNSRGLGVKTYSLPAVGNTFSPIYKGKRADDGARSPSENGAGGQSGAPVVDEFFADLPEGED